MWSQEKLFLLSGRFLINSHLADHKFHYCNKWILWFSNPLPAIGGSEGERSLQVGNTLHLIVLTAQSTSLHIYTCRDIPEGCQWYSCYVFHVIYNYYESYIAHNM